MAVCVRAGTAAGEKTITRQIIEKCSPMLQDCNLMDECKVEELVASILGRLTSGYTETILCDVLAIFDLHTILNLACLDSEVQTKMIALVVRYFKQKHDSGRI